MVLALQGFPSSDVVLTLIEEGVPVNGKTLEGSTILIDIIMEDFSKIIEIVAAMLRSGADANMQADDGRTPLMAAATRRNSQLVALLLGSGAAPNAQAEDGYTALHFAAKFGGLETIELLKRAGAELGMQNSRGKTPFDVICSCKDSDETSFECDEGCTRKNRRKVIATLKE